MLGEVRDKIYEQFPNLKTNGNDEPLTGAKMYISEIVKTYNTRSSFPVSSVNPDDVAVVVGEESKKKSTINDLADKIQKDFNDDNKSQEDTVIICILIER